MSVNNETHEATGLSDHYLQLIGDSFDKVNSYLAFLIKETIKKILGQKPNIL